MIGQHPAAPPADAWDYARHHTDIQRDGRFNAPQTISALPYDQRAPAMAQRDRARREAFMDAYRIAPMQSPSHGHRETSRRFERLVTTSAIVAVLLLVAYHAVRYIAGVL